MQVQSPPFLPLPVRDGIAPSYIWIPEGHWDNVFLFLQDHFPDVAAHTWRARLDKQEVVDQHGNVLIADSTVKRGMCIYYYREIENETPIPLHEEILFQDEHLLVVDKPHFLPVIPSGRFLQETLLVRLKKNTGLMDLTPIHRLDRETAGVMLFSHNPSTRGQYQSLFQRKSMAKTYHAVAKHLSELSFPLRHCSRMEEAEKFFVMREVNGIANSETLIDIKERRGENSLYQLQPVTGRKHQLRLHMSSLGAPIVNDAFYPVALPCKADDFSAPLQLLAKSIRFDDPLTGRERYFESRKSL
ncbi:pseudouridine synthase [Undibacterium sp.]|uniref:pseudouridine synthase n=1 Tax=Undibacterium sp. TaxID=1914977 RepID=UPI002730BF3D|nr:pseudouridine synthase [Undibacterium sp.]MDP1979748.1 pseudouridine synthase [Undibacterium sp.]